ncbi:MAG: extracellular solute-binding protein [Bacillota bacterium]|nr:extracellular solute-binding protein [Bacillota bacterium]
MKGLNVICFSLLLCVLMISSSCGQAPNQPLSNTNPKAQTAVPSESSLNAEIKVWAANTGLDSFKQDFESMYPKIKINITKFDSLDKFNNECLSALSSGTGPDVLFFDSSFFGQYTVNGILEDLLKDPYLAGRYEKDFSEDVWESNKSADGKSLLAMTYLTSPYVTFYREDIMKENGFPSEPEEFGKFIEKPENLLAIAKKIKPKGEYIFQWPTDLPNLMGSSVGIFDKNLRFMRNTNEFAKILDITKEAHRAGFELEASVWEPAGEKAIEDNKLVMVFNMGSWGSGSIQNFAPEQSGKWRVTKPPLGICAWQSDTKIAINSQSNNKKSAWKFVEYVFTQQSGGINYDMVNGYKPSRRNNRQMEARNSFLGEQVTQPLYEDLADKMIQYKLTPLDNTATEIFAKDISDATVRNIDSKTAIRDIADKIEKTLEEERKDLIEN